MLQQRRKQSPEAQKHSQNYRFSLPDQESCLGQMSRANTLQECQVKKEKEKKKGFLPAMLSSHRHF